MEIRSNEELLNDEFGFLFYESGDNKELKTIPKGRAKREIALKVCRMREFGYYRPSKYDPNDDVIMEYSGNVWELYSDTVVENQLKILCECNIAIREYITRSNSNISSFINNILEEMKMHITHSGEFEEIDVKSGDTSIIFLNGTLTFKKEEYIFRENYYNRKDNATLQVRLNFRKSDNEDLLKDNEMYELLKVKMGGDENKAKFICALLYNWVNTKQNSDIMPYFYGTGGDGKSIFINILSNTFQGYVNEMAISSLISKFNNESYLMKPLGVVKEVENIEFRESNGALKSLISRETMRTERKGIDAKMSPVIVKLFAVGNQKLGIKHENAELVRLAYFGFSHDKFKPEIENLEEHFLYKKQDIINCIIYGYLYAKEHKLYKSTREFGERYLTVFYDELDKTIYETRKDIAENKEYIEYCKGGFLDIKLMDELRQALLIQNQGNYVKIYNIINGEKSLDINNKVNNLISLTHEFSNIGKYRPNNKKIIDLNGIRKYELTKHVYYTNVVWNTEFLEEILNHLENKSYLMENEYLELRTKVRDYISIIEMTKYVDETTSFPIIEYLETQEKR